MIPKDAPQQDWNLYYDHTYMVHQKLGPCMIRVESDHGGNYKFYAYKIKSNAQMGSSNSVAAEDLRIMWPRPGAYNFPRFGQAAFIGRTPQRHMKRSAYSDHYYLSWAITAMTQNHIMAQICLPPKYWTIDQFKKRSVNTEGTITAAISSKVILTKNPNIDEIGVVYMTESIGTLEKDTLIPDMPHDSRMGRMRRHLSTVGIK